MTQRRLGAWWRKAPRASGRSLNYWTCSPQNLPWTARCLFPHNGICDLTFFKNPGNYTHILYIKWMWSLHSQGFRSWTWNFSWTPLFLCIMVILHAIFFHRPLASFRAQNGWCFVSNYTLYSFYPPHSTCGIVFTATYSPFALNTVVLHKWRCLPDSAISVKQYNDIVRVSLKVPIGLSSVSNFECMSLMSSYGCLVPTHLRVHFPSET